jgi:hypothetical protein
MKLIKETAIKEIRVGPNGEPTTWSAIWETEDRRFGFARYSSFAHDDPPKVSRWRWQIGIGSRGTDADENLLQATGLWAATFATRREAVAALSLVLSN